MLRGDAGLVCSIAKPIIDAALREAYVGERWIDWTAKTWQHADAVFKLAAQSMAIALAGLVADRGDVKYIEGKLSKADWKCIEMAVKIFFQSLSPSGKLLKERVKCAYSKIVKALEPELKKHGVANGTKR